MKYSFSMVCFLLLFSFSLNDRGCNDTNLAQTHTPGYEVAVDGLYAYVTNNDGVAVYDISNPTETERIGQISLSESHGIKAKDDILFIAGMSRGLVIADVSESVTNPTILSEYTLSDYVTQVSIIDTYAYVATGGGLVQILDIGDLNNPEDLGHLTISGLTLGLAVYGDTIFIAQPDSGLKIIDASDLNSLQSIKCVSGTSGARDLHVQGEYLYLARGTFGVDILDIPDPINPELIGNFNDGGHSFGLHGDSRYLCVADLDDGVEIVDISNLENPVESTEYNDAAPHDLLYRNRCAYVADQDEEFILIDFSDTIPEYEESITHANTSSYTALNNTSTPIIFTTIMICTVGFLSVTIIVWILKKKR